LGLEQWSHIWVFYWFDQNDTPEKRAVLQVHPRGNRNNPLTGVFATRSPMRPNLTALSLCRVVSIQGNDIEIEAIDAFDQTPVIDIKPYIQELDTPRDPIDAPGWMETCGAGPRGWVRQRSGWHSADLKRPEPPSAEPKSNALMPPSLPPSPGS
jgi:tRNA (Thr-GGU) A37 N-methylase